MKYIFAMTFGTRLHQALTAAKMERKVLALHLGVSPQAIGMVITGGGKAERKLSPDNTRKAAKLLKVDSEWLATGENPQATEHHAPAELASLSHEAIDLAVFFDMLTDKIDRAIAQNIAMTEILRLLSLRGDLPTAGPIPLDSLKKQPA